MYVILSNAHSRSVWIPWKTVSNCVTQSFEIGVLVIMFLNRKGTKNNVGLKNFAKVYAMKNSKQASLRILWK